MSLNDLATLTAQPRPITVGGEVYLIHPLTLGEFGKLQAWVDAQFPDPFAIAAEAIEAGDYNVAQQQYLLKCAMEMKAAGANLMGTPEADAKVYSTEGCKQLIFLGIAKGRPGFTAADAAALFDLMSLSDLRRVYEATNADMVLSDPKAPSSTGVPTG